MHQSLATLDNPEFINLQPMEVNPLMSQCEIKVLYVGKNRNGSFISKDVATDMAKTLRGAPIVGYYKEDKEDFRDHGHEVIIDDEGIKFNCKTVPYGFVAPDAKVWFQKFTDTNEFGEETTREYLMTTGYLWTGQYQECAAALQGDGKNQSMELDETTIDGHWSYDDTTNMEFFIINDAMFSKLCILGDDVEPCFEGARVTAPTISSSFSLDKDFKNTLYNMMQQLNFALKGGVSEMDTHEELEAEVSVEESVEEVVSEAGAEDAVPATENSLDDSSLVEDTSTPASETDSEFVDNKDQDNDDENDEDDNDDVDDDDDNKDDDVDDDKKDSYSLEVENLNNSITELTNELQNMKDKYSLLETEYNKLLLEKKQQMIDKFTMLSEEDKAEVIENINSYSLDEIEAKLSVIFARLQVKNDSETIVKNDNIVEDSLTYTLESNVNEPEWIKAVKANRNKEN